MPTDHEPCCGCGEPHATPTAFVAVLKDGDAFLARAICDACFTDPSHRTTAVKAAFHRRANAALAIDAARRSAATPAGQDQGVFA